MARKGFEEWIRGKCRLESMEVIHQWVDFKMDFVSNMVCVDSVCADEHNCDKKYLNRQFLTLFSFIMAKKCGISLYFINF